MEIPADLVARLNHLERVLAELTRRVYELETRQGLAHSAEQVGEAPIKTSVPSQSASAIPSPTAPPILEPEPVAQSSTPAPQRTEAAIQGGGAAAAEREAAPVPPAPPTDWESVLGGNLLNKVGAFLLVIGIALALGYSFSHMGPAGRDAVGLAGSLAMLGTGVFCERRPSYRTFARGLIGGGWAALYFTVYAMHALAAAKVIESPLAGAALLAAIGAGMIAHALRYRSEAVAGVAYFSAFVALGITEVTSFSVVALIPLAASLLYVAHRFHWRKLALFGLIATYVTCVSRGDAGAPLWSSQAVFAVYWLLFEAFDILDPAPWIVPLNAVGFLSLSLLKWSAADPGSLWVFLAVTAVAYAASGAFRARRSPDAKPLEGGWEGPATMTAGLAAAALLRRLDHQWLLIGLAAEAELFYLAGLRLRARYLRLLAIPLFGLALLHLTAVETAELPVRAWAPVAALIALLFYANRALRPVDAFYGYAAAAVAALIGGYEAPAREAGRVWFPLAAGPFFFGWWRRLPDFRFQGYALAALAVVGTALTFPHPPASTAIAAAVSYGLAVCALWSSHDRFEAWERSSLFNIASTAGAVALAVLLRAELAPAATGPAWAAEALALASAALIVGKRALEWQGCAVALAALIQCWAVNLYSGETMLAAAAAVACFYGAQLLTPRGRDARLFYSLLGTALLSALLYYKISGSVLTVAWGMEGLALLGAGFPLRDRVLRLSGLFLLLSCILKLFIHDLSYLETLPRIFSFIVLGLILIGVSWIYTRFRERLQRYL